MKTKQELEKRLEEAVRIKWYGWYKEAEKLARELGRSEEEIREYKMMYIEVPLLRDKWYDAALELAKELGKSEEEQVKRCITKDLEKAVSNGWYYNTESHKNIEEMAKMIGMSEENIIEYKTRCLEEQISNRRYDAALKLAKELGKSEEELREYKTRFIEEQMSHKWYDDALKLAKKLGRNDEEKIRERMTKDLEEDVINDRSYYDIIVLAKLLGRSKQEVKGYKAEEMYKKGRYTEGSPFRATEMYLKLLEKIQLQMQPRECQKYLKLKKEYKKLKAIGLKDKYKSPEEVLLQEAKTAPEVESLALQTRALYAKLAWPEKFKEKKIKEIKQAIAARKPKELQLKEAVSEGWYCNAAKLAKELGRDHEIIDEYNYKYNAYALIRRMRRKKYSWRQIGDKLKNISNAEEREQWDNLQYEHLWTKEKLSDMWIHYSKWAVKAYRKAANGKCDVAKNEWCDLCWNKAAEIGNNIASSENQLKAEYHALREEWAEAAKAAEEIKQWDDAAVYYERAGKTKKAEEIKAKGEEEE